MSEQHSVVKCPGWGCRERLEVYWDEDDRKFGYESPSVLERTILEHHLSHRHTEAVVVRDGEEPRPVAIGIRKRYLIESSGVPTRYRAPSRRPDDDVGAAVWAEAAEWCRDCLGDSNLVIYGGTGVGKTTLAARILHYAAEFDADSPLQHASVLYWLHVGDFSRRARRLLATGRASELDDVLTRAQEADYLFLDDLGAERPTEFVRDLVADLIEYRYDQSYGSMIVTTNYTPDELAARLGGDDPMIGDRLVGRLCEGATQLHYPGRDRRLPEAA